MKTEDQTLEDTVKNIPENGTNNQYISPAPNDYTEMRIPKDGTKHKYITGLNKDGERVVVAQPINYFEYHRNIVKSYEREHGDLTNIAGGWVRFEDGIYQFGGSSGDFGRADHEEVSAIVNRGSEPARKYHAEKEARRLKELDDTRREERKERVKRIAKGIGGWTAAAAILILPAFGLYKACSSMDECGKEIVKEEFVEIEATPESVESYCFSTSHSSNGTYILIADVNGRSIIAKSHRPESCTNAVTVEALVNKEIRDGNREKIRLKGKYSDSKDDRFIVYSVEVGKHKITTHEYDWSD